MTDAERIVQEAMLKSNERETAVGFCKALGSVLWAVAFGEKTLGLSRWQWMRLCWDAWQSLPRRKRD